VNDDRSARSERIRAKKRLPSASPSETAATKPAELEPLSAEPSKETKSMSDAKATDTTVANAVKIAGEGLVFPGASLLIDGDLKGGGAHLVIGLAAKALIGPIGWFLVAADSFSRSSTGKNLYEHFAPAKKDAASAA
jgi:hypothetical protein